MEEEASKKKNVTALELSSKNRYKRRLQKSLDHQYFDNNNIKNVIRPRFLQYNKTTIFQRLVMEDRNLHLQIIIQEMESRFVDTLIPRINITNA